MRHPHGDHSRGETRGVDGVREAAMKKYRHAPHRPHPPRHLERRRRAGHQLHRAGIARRRGDGGNRRRPKPLDPTQLDSYLAIHRDGSATVFFGKIDGGQGTDVGIAQIVAEELDLPGRQSRSRHGRHRPDHQSRRRQRQLRHYLGRQADAPRRQPQARQTFAALAAKRLNAPVEKLTVSNGIVSVERRTKQEGDLRPSSSAASS